VVPGSLEDKSAAGFGGGFPELSIARRDARVTRIALSKYITAFFYALFWITLCVKILKTQFQQ
jgi:hypothetical protein